MAASEMVHVLEHCRVSPPPGSVDEESLPLTFFDLIWLHFPVLQHLLFYEFPHPKAYFVDTIIPRLKQSLSLTLKHFFPLSGNLIFPPDCSIPELRYAEGDSVSLTFAESILDFGHLTGNHHRNVADFQPLIAQLPPGSSTSGTVVAPLLAIQVTLFPNSGICIGFSLHHVSGDGTMFTGFIRSWALINKLGGDESLVESGNLPFYDRTMIKDPDGLTSIFWTHFGKRKFEVFQPPLPSNKVRATFIMAQADVQRLKKCVSSKLPTLSHVSTFTVTCAYVWSCMIKARARSGEDQVDENESEHFVFSADCRALLDPPMPETYFGNCIAGCFATAKTKELIHEEDGFIAAANAIAKAIQERVRSKEGVVKGAEKWLSGFESLNMKRIVGVAGSTRFMVYDMDFGLGNAKKSEVISIGDSLSLNECKDDKENFEVGLSFSKIKMDAFADIFANGLKVYS